MLRTVEGYRKALFEADRYFFALHVDIIAPGGRSHDGFDDADAARKLLEVFGFVRRTEEIRVRGVGLLSRHLVAEAGFLQEGRHLGPAAELIDEEWVEPGLVDLQIGVDE